MSGGPGRPTAPLAAGHDARIQRYLAELRIWGARTNLVGSTDAAALRVHVEEALAVADLIPPGARVVDLGSGAGFPGVPIQIARPDLCLTLVEVRERRFHFLRHVARVLELPCEVRRVRIEDPPEVPFDLALLRAVAPLERSVQLGRPWVTRGGEIWVWTREPSPWPEEALAGRFPLPGSGRGCVLRVLASAVPRGTS